MLSNNIKVLRKNRGFTQEELAARLHVTRQTVSKWEHGYSVHDAQILSDMADVLDVHLKDYFDDHGGSVKVTEQENLQLIE